MKTALTSIVILIASICTAQYKETLHATIGPTNSVVTSIPDWAKSDTPPESSGGVNTNQVEDIVEGMIDGNYVPLTTDRNGNKTSVTIGNRATNSIVGKSSLTVGEGNSSAGGSSVVVGYANSVSGGNSFAVGSGITSSGLRSLSSGYYCSVDRAAGDSVALGAKAHAKDSASFVWSGIYFNGLYPSMGEGTFNIYPKNNINGFFISGIPLMDYFTNYVTDTELSDYAKKTDLEGFATEAELLSFYYPDGSVTNMNQISDSGINWGFTNGEAYVFEVQGDGFQSNTVLPWKVNSKGKDFVVTRIHKYAFYGRDELQKIVVPITVKEVGESAFQNCSSLEYVSIPSITNIEMTTFTSCSSLSSVYLPSVKTISPGAFMNCTALDSVYFPYVTSLSYNAFSSCTSLKSISFPSVEKVLGEAFFNCPSITSVSLPSVKDIDFLAFADNISLTYLSLPSVTNIGNSAFNYCTSLQYVSLPSVINMGTSAFNNCNSLEHIYIPFVNKIGDGAFYDCTSLKTVDFGASPKQYAPTIGEMSFYNVPITCKFIIPITMYNDWFHYYVWNSLRGQGYKFEGYASVDDVKNQTPTQISNGSETRTADSIFKSMDNQNVLWTYVYGESVWFAVTNYMRTISGVAPSFQLWEVRDGKTNCVYWSAEEIDVRVGDKIDIAVSNVAHSVATSKADRAWSKYQSMTGADNPQPNDITIVSTPSVMLSGGYEWQRFVDTGNELWVLKCNCPTMLGSSSVSNGINTSNGYFQIKDAEGKTHFSVEKTDSRLVDAVPNSVSFYNDGNQYFHVSFQSNIKPSLYVSTDLNIPFIECKEDTENDYGLTCSWVEENGIYTATIMYNIAEGKPSKMFAYGKVMQEGSVVIKNTAATSFDGGIIIGGTKYTTIGTAVIDGKTVLTLEGGQAVSE